MLIRDAEQSPFNVTEPIRLEPFSRAQLATLNGLFGRPLRDGELDLLHELTGGQPYLGRLAFYRLGPAFGVRLRDLDATAAADEGPFGEHLRAKMAQLGRRPDLAGAMARLVHETAYPRRKATTTPARRRVGAAGGRPGRARQPALRAASSAAC